MTKLDSHSVGALSRSLRNSQVRLLILCPIPSFHHRHWSLNNLPRSSDELHSILPENNKRAHREDHVDHGQEHDRRSAPKHRTLDWLPAWEEGQDGGEGLEIKVH